MDKRILIPVILLLGAAAAGTWYWQRDESGKRGDGSLRIYGNIDVRLVNLAFDASGRIMQMVVAEGARGKIGRAHV